MTIIIIIAAIIALPFIIALFLPKEYALERNIVINAPKQTVFDYIKHIKNQENYSKWVMADPDMKRNLSGTDGTIGFIYAWDGNKKVGAGEQEITGLADGERITTQLRFIRPFKNTALTYQTTQPLSDHSTKVAWGMAGKSPYPMNLMTALLKGVLNKDLDTSLANLKNILEK